MTQLGRLCVMPWTTINLPDLPMWGLKAHESLGREHANASGEGNEVPEYTYCRECGKKHDGCDTVEFPPDRLSPWGHSFCLRCFYKVLIRAESNGGTA